MDPDWTLHPLRQWREAQGYSLDQAAPLVGARRQTWHDWENGRRVPGVEFLNRIFKVTGGTVRADDFVWPFGYPCYGGRSVRELFAARHAGGGRKRNDVVAGTAVA